MLKLAAWSEDRKEKFIPDCQKVNEDAGRVGGIDFALLSSLFLHANSNSGTLHCSAALCMIEDKMKTRRKTTENHYWNECDFPGWSANCVVGALDEVIIRLIQHSETWQTT